jgi:hypothetical protein
MADLSTDNVIRSEPSMRARDSTGYAVSRAAARACPAPSSGVVGVGIEDASAGACVSGKGPGRQESRLDHRGCGRCLTVARQAM